MWKILFLISYILLVNVVLQCGALPKKCEKEEKLFGVLELVKDSILKAKYYTPKSNHKNNVTHQNQFLHEEKEKSVVYLDLALELIKQSEKESPSSDIGNVGELEKEKMDNEKLPKNCFEVMQRRHIQSGIYTIYLFNETANIDRTVDVYCDMDTDGGGWTVIQRRAYYLVNEKFDRYWMDYKNGFGSLNKDFWIGNDIIYALTNTGSNTVRFDFRDVNGDTAYAFYKYFSIENEANGYRLHIENYSGTAGDSMLTKSNGQRFSTKDRFSDGAAKTCPLSYGGGWWYSDCAECNPNGWYGLVGNRGIPYTFWYSWKKNYESLAFIEIKIRNS